MNKFIAAAFAALVASVAFAAETSFATLGECVAAAQDSKAVSYMPKQTKVDEGYKKSSVGAEFDGAYSKGFCAKDGDTTHTATTKPWVFYGPEFEVGVKGGDVVMWKCKNRFPQNRTAIPAKNQLSEPAAQTGCKDCKTEAVTTVDRVIKEGETFCEDKSGKRFPPVEGKCKFAEAVAEMPVKVETPVSTACYTQGCAWKQQATFRGEVKAKICGIVVGNVGPKDRFLWLATDEKSGNLQITELVDEDLNADGTVNKTVLAKKFANKTVKSMLTNRKVSASCDTDQEFVEKEVWHHMVKYFDFPDACVIAGRVQGPRK